MDADSSAVDPAVGHRRRPVALDSVQSDRHTFLGALGTRVRALRARRGMTRKALAVAAQVSERHLANLELGVGNASVLILLQVAEALQCPLAELLGDVTTSSSEWLMIRNMLERRDEPTLRNVRSAIGKMLGSANAASRRNCIALIGLRGAGKSTLGRMLADELRVPFVELSEEVETLAGCSVAEVQALYGQAAYRRYERRALEEAIKRHGAVVIATPGGLVSDVASFNLLLDRCTTVWLRAEPEDHMGRVIAQGDMRPMGTSPRARKEAMNDLRSILASRAAFYAKADHTIDTSAQDLASTFDALRAVLALPAGGRSTLAA
jgi:XRE family transcriptional regulator, aerobic/anaerobic benzoate catabolism transcriptional regulator